MKTEKQIMHLRSTHAEETHEIGKVLAGQVGGGDIIALTADLGGGKTTLTQGICAGLHVCDYVTSPTFTLIQEYQGVIPVVHFDFYRLHSVEEIENLGLDMYFNPQTLSIIEWAERGESLLPEETIHIRMRLVFEADVLQEQSRHIEIESPADRPVKEMEPWLS